MNHFSCPYPSVFGRQAISTGRWLPLHGGLQSSNRGVGVDVDINKAFDTIPHEHLEAMLRRKISDRRSSNLSMKLSKAEVIGR